MRSLTWRRLALTLLLAATPAWAQPDEALPEPQSAALQDWYTKVGARRPRESLGNLILRAGHTQMGRPYDEAPWHPGPEKLTCRVDTFDCVSFVENTLALARCVFRNTADATCFAREVQSLRYRGGTIDGYPSRLHYFEDWLADNQSRRHIRLLTETLGGQPHRIPFYFMTRHPDRFPALADPNNRLAVAAAERRLSRTPLHYIDGETLPKIYSRLRDGDIVAIASLAPGLCITHTGFVQRDADGLPHLLHASSAHHHVTLSPGDLAHYLGQQPTRVGVVIARPLPPTDNP